jgi:hypothetical protein
MISLSEEQLEDGATVLLQPFGDGGDLHAFKDGGHAGGEELIIALNFDHAQAACADIAEAVEVAEGRYVNVVFAGHFEDGLAGAGADFLSIDDECFDVD